MTPSLPWEIAVERLTERKVIAFIRGDHTEHDIASELFILDAPV